MAKSNLLSGRVRVVNPKDVSNDRYQFLDLSQAEPNLGVPDFSASLSGSPAIVVSDSDGNRGFVRSLDLDRVSGQFTGSFSGSGELSGSFTGSFTGSFIGDGSGLVNLPAATFIASGSSTASFVEGDLVVNTNTTILGNLIVSQSIIADQLIVNLISSSIIYSSGSNIFGNQITDIQQFTGSVQIQTELIANSVTASSATGSFTGSFRGDGSGLINVPAAVAPLIASGSVTASVSDRLGFVVSSSVSGSLFIGDVRLASGSVFSGSGRDLFNIPRTALSEDALISDLIASGSVTASVSPNRGFVVTSTASGSLFFGDVRLASGSVFSGSGRDLFNIPRSALTEDAQVSALIASGSVTASVSPNKGFVVESVDNGSTFSGSVFLSSGSFYSGSGEGLFNIPQSALSQEVFRIASGSVTASVSPNKGFVVESVNSGSTFSGSVFLSSGSFYSGSGAGLFNIPRTALTEDAQVSSLIASGSVTASVGDDRGFRVQSSLLGSQFTGSINVLGRVTLETGNFFSGSGAGLFDIPLSALAEEVVAATTIQSGSVTASVSPDRGFVVISETNGSEFTGSVDILGNVSASMFSGSGRGLFDIPRTALADDVFISNLIASGSITASVSPDRGFIVESVDSGSTFSGSIFLSSGSFFSGSGEQLFNIPQSALAFEITQIASGSVTASVSPDKGFVVESVDSGSTFSGSIFLSSGSFFSGSGEQLFNIPQSALAFEINQIASGSVTASVSPNRGFVVESVDNGSTFSGSVFLSSGSFYSGSGRGLFDIPQSALSQEVFRIASGSVTASVSPNKGFVVESVDSGSTFSGSIFLSSGSFFSGSGRNLFDIPQSALSQEVFRIASGSVTASVSPNRGFLVESVDSGSTFSGSIFLSSGSFYSGSGAGLFDIPISALTEDAIRIATGSVTASVDVDAGFVVQSPDFGSTISGSLVIDTTHTSAATAVTIFDVSANGSSAYVINGQSNPTLTLTEGETYTFNINAPGHPFWIKTVNSTGTGNAYNDGVTNNGIASGTITFVVPTGAPTTLFYNCQFHSSMFGTINIVEAGIQAPVNTGVKIIGDTDIDGNVTITGSLIVSSSNTFRNIGPAQFTGSLFITGGNVVAASGSFFSGSGEGLFDIPRAALADDALISNLMASGSVTASVSDEFGFVVTSILSGSIFSGSVFLSSGSFFSGSGEKLFNIPRTALTEDELISTEIKSG